MANTNHGKACSRTLDASHELAALDAAVKVLQDESAGTHHTGRMLPVGVLKHREQWASKVLACKGFPIQTDKAAGQVIQRAFPYLTERGCELFN